MNRWIVPSNIKSYDVIAAFSKLECIDWTQRIKDVKVGDTVYVYVGAPISAIKYTCEVIATNLRPGTDQLIDDDEFVRDSAFNNASDRDHMRLKKIGEFNNELTFSVLQNHGWKGSVQSARAVPAELADYIDSIQIDSNHRYPSFDIDYKKLHSLEDAFIKHEMDTHGVDPRDTLDGTTFRIKEAEGYKRHDYDKYHARILNGPPYLETFMKAYSNSNLADYHSENLKKIVDDYGEVLELALESLYEGNDDAAAFNDIVNIIGGRFDIIGLMFFLKDCDKYLPIRSQTFDNLFALMGIESNLAGNCTWSNYKKFCSTIKVIQKDLAVNVNKDITVLDAHSFVWSLGSIAGYEKKDLRFVEHRDLGKGTVVRYEDDDKSIVVKFGKEEKKYDIELSFGNGVLKYVETEYDNKGSSHELGTESEKNTKFKL